MRESSRLKRESVLLILAHTDSYVEYDQRRDEERIEEDGERSHM